MLQMSESRNKNGWGRRITRVMSLAADYWVFDAASAHDLTRFGPQSLGINLGIYWNMFKQFYLRVPLPRIGLDIFGLSIV